MIKNLLKIQKEKLIESKTKYESDLSLYKRFKENTMNDIMNADKYGIDYNCGENNLVREGKDLCRWHCL